MTFFITHFADKIAPIHAELDANGQGHIRWQEWCLNKISLLSEEICGVSSSKLWSIFLPLLAGKSCQRRGRDTGGRRWWILPREKGWCQRPWKSQWSSLSSNTHEIKKLLIVLLVTLWQGLSGGHSRLRSQTTFSIKWVSFGVPQNKFSLMVLFLCKWVVLVNCSRTCPSPSFFFTYLPG